MKKLPYRAQTRMGDSFNIEFPLHEETVDPVRVEQFVTAALTAIDKELVAAGETSNGDVLQAIAMVLAIRSRMIHSPRATVERLAAQLLHNALDAAYEASRETPPVGHA